MPKQTIRELKTKHAEILSAIKEINLKEERGALPPEDKAKLETLFKDGTALKAQIETRERVKELELSAVAERPWKKENRSFSLQKVIAASARKTPLSGYEAEVSAECAKSYPGNAIDGIVIPIESVFGRAAPPRKLEARIIDGETDLFSNPMRPDQLLPALRENSIFAQLGMKVINAMGRFHFPVITGATSGFFSGSGGGAAGDKIPESDLSAESLSSTPKFQGVFSTFSLAQAMNMSGDLSIENLIRNDLNASMAEKLDEKILKGSGAANEPKGLLSYDTIEKTTLANPVTWTLDTLLEQQEKLSVAFKCNNKSRPARWLINPKVEREWKGKQRFTDGPAPLLSDDMRAAGLETLVTNHMGAAEPASAAGDVEVVLGVFMELLFISYGSAVIETGYFNDQFVRGSKTVKMTMPYDVMLLRKEAFRFIQPDRTA